MQFITAIRSYSVVFNVLVFILSTYRSRFFAKRLSMISCMLHTDDIFLRIAKTGHISASIDTIFVRSQKYDG